MSDAELAKDRGLISAMTIGIGTMIGAGISVLPGVGANTRTSSRTPREQLFGRE